MRVVGCSSASRQAAHMPVRRLLGSRGFFSGALSAVFRAVDPDRVTAKEMTAQIKELEARMAKEGQYRKNELAAELTRLKNEEQTYKKSATARELWTLGLGFASFALGVIAYLDDTWGRVPLVDVSRVLRHRVKESLEANEYVERPALEAVIASSVGVRPSVEYEVLVGPRGCGKTSLALHVLSQYRGVAKLSVSGETENAYARILKAFGINPNHYDVSDQQALTELLKKSAAWHRRLQRIRNLFFNTGVDSTWVPTVVVEIDENTTISTIPFVAKQLKNVASDDKCVRIIVVLGDVLALFAWPKDEDRQGIIWINDLTEEEARALMEKRNFEATEEEKQLIFRRVGTRASTVVKLLRDVQRKREPSVEAAVNDRIAKAKLSLGSQLSVQFRPDDPDKIDFKAIFDALLKSPSGVPVASFSGATRRPEKCATYFKEFHAFLYYTPEGKYVFHSRAHYEAAKELRAEKQY